MASTADFEANCVSKSIFAVSSPRVITFTFTNGEEKVLNGIKVKALLTPGHTRGSVCYLITAKDGGRYLFTGDTLFAGSIGRTDFETGNVGDLRLSLKKLRDLEGDYPVYPGHGEETTLEEERKTNPFLIF